METKGVLQDESFRDSIATITKEGKRAWIYAQKPKGKRAVLRIRSQQGRPFFPIAVRGYGSMARMFIPKFYRPARSKS